MTKYTIQAHFNTDIKTIWNIVTSLNHYSWRSDIEKIDIINENQFIEFTKEGYPTTFTTTVKEKYQRWEFDMENSNMKGHWIGIFNQKDEITEIEFIEEVVPKKLIMKPFVKTYIKKQQQTYIKDLTKAIENIK